MAYRIINKLDCSKDSNKCIALKYDAGQIKSEKYGAATLSGYLLYATRYKEFPSINVKPVEQNADVWLKDTGLEKYRDEVMEKIKIPSVVAYSGAGADAKKLEMYFKFLLFAFFYDDALTKLSHLNENNTIKQQEDILAMSLAENLFSIIESRGDSKATEAAASKLHPIFKTVCTILSNVCRSGFEQMSEEDYKRFSRELLDFLSINKWMQEYQKSPYKEKEFLFLRIVDGATSLMLFLVCFAKDIRIRKEIRMHRLFQRYYQNVITQAAISNDVLSLQKEIAHDEEFNLVFVKCQKHSLQRSIYKAEKAANDLVIDLKKDKFRLLSYFPEDESLKNFIETAEYMMDGLLYWYQHSNRYGKMKFETYVVEYGSDYTGWLEQRSTINVKNMKELKLSSDSESDNGAIPSLHE